VSNLVPLPGVPQKLPDRLAPRVTASVLAEVGQLVVPPGKPARLVLLIDETTMPEVYAELRRAQDDGPQHVVMVSTNPSRALPGLEADGTAERVAIGLRLVDALAADLLAAASPATGAIEPDETRPAPPPLPVGTAVGQTHQEAREAVARVAREATREAARAAGRAVRRGAGRRQQGEG
jgi:hypothetical protein